ncbi:MAG: hypothetical protein AB7O59_16565 [Pirellulales bacterium]
MMRIGALMALVVFYASAGAGCFAAADAPPAASPPAASPPAASPPANAAPAANELDRRIAALIEQLGDERYAVRQRAQEELAQIGYDAFDALCEAEASDDPEIALRAAYLVRTIRIDWTLPGDPPQVRQILHDYPSQSDERRAVRIRQLAELPAGQGLEWLCRLVRFEQSPLVSKRAALAIMDQETTDAAAAWQARAALLRKHMERSRRPAAKWLLNYLAAHDDPAAALATWSELAQTERRTMETHPQETNSKIVVALLTRKVELLDRLQRTGELDAVLREMVECERGDARSLAELVELLSRRKAWNVVDEVAARFAATFDLDALLLYTLADARRVQGNTTAANDTAQKALQLGGDNPLEHLDVAARLIDRGLTEWSDLELRHVLALGPIASPTSIRARLTLSDSLHDRLRDGDAGDLLKELMDAIDADPNVLQQAKLLLQQNNRSVDFLRARMHFYFASAAKQRDDARLEREHLDKAIDAEPSDLDVIIALYRLGDDDPLRREKLNRLMKAVSEACQTAIEDDPDDPVNYNEWAWLVANTEGDMDEALRMSHKSVELVRAEAASDADFKRLGQYLDTLAHCYFAKKDYDAAVRYQAEAAKLDPHTLAIGRQLAVFRQTQASAAPDKKLPDKQLPE